MNEGGGESQGLFGRIKEKLIRSKRQTAAEGRHITGKTDLAHVRRLPPGQNLVTKWPVLDLGVQPDVPKAEWRLHVTGLVANPVTWSFDDFMALPQSHFKSDIHCVTTWSLYDNRWDGVSARTILDLVQPPVEARHVIFHSYDGYTTNIRREVFEEEDVIIVHSWEGKPLTREHGGPVRAVVPKWYFWKSAKWLSKIEFSDVDKPGFWEQNGYHNEADPWKEERYS
ncbi:sulfite oxidase-like oxidoreductase [Parvibaculum sp.]|jgi:DMSO/TMAO reductase YedYZ molybdopterin-dependent catalytic subunit|uniref:sulfite oxidase-like oxidoreductase n=2 Tax=Parvibaculum sp. TaxID=2024848 RepID=UPI001B21C230|nr:sulfite oxidase-like oxidoreductase [Parvibaculum sp.]MBO6633443.1 sulfite oxidase-like oxidoreductase [Parvibaculum sp.]MBO6680187.1 sulfite oxidase-like oxidoreductase [Parvibaculum sp.]MBO6903510.1 sulfite oxidase-like oxidoreductase [Parvibaculum sp.]